MQTPPALPRKHVPISRWRGHNIAGAVALGAGLASAGLTFGTLPLWREVGEYRNSQASYVTEGAIGFSLSLLPWALTFVTLALGLISFILLCASISKCRKAHVPWLTFTNIGAMLSLTPVFYLLLMFGMAILRELMQTSLGRR